MPSPCLRRTLWTLSIAWLIASCAPSVALAPEDPGFPTMSTEQAGALRRCVAAEPSLGEWVPRFTKAWCKARGISAEDCRG